MTIKLCGAETPNGPCTMPQNHDANYHRHREYVTTTWKIKAGGKIIEEGQARVPLNYAITRAMVNHPKIVIELNRD